MVQPIDSKNGRLCKTGKGRSKSIVILLQQLGMIRGRVQICHGDLDVV